MYLRDFVFLSSMFRAPPRLLMQWETDGFCDNTVSQN
uniref:Uncharacterized protein n=1 Tax=Anguilla anguilla TaxID=7936 RepID=A0A0E9VZ36_ANGAN